MLHRAKTDLNVIEQSYTRRTRKCCVSCTRCWVHNEQV